MRLGVIGSLCFLSDLSGLTNLSLEPKRDAKEPRRIIHLGMMGDGTKEQNLGERGDPAKRIKEDEEDAAFNQPAKKKEL